MMKGTGDRRDFPVIPSRLEAMPTRTTCDLVFSITTGRPDSGLPEPKAVGPVSGPPRGRSSAEPGSNTAPCRCPRTPASPGLSGFPGAKAFGSKRCAEDTGHVSPRQEAENSGRSTGTFLNGMKLVSRTCSASLRAIRPSADAPGVWRGGGRRAGRAVVRAV